MITNTKQLILEFDKFTKFINQNSGLEKIIYDLSFKLQQGDILALIGEKNSGIEIFEKNLHDLFKDFGGSVKLVGKNIQAKRQSKENLYFLHKNLQNIQTTQELKQSFFQNVYQFIEEAFSKKWMEKNDFPLFLCQPTEENKLYFFQKLEICLSNSFHALETFNKEIRSFFKYLSFRKQDFFASYVLQRNLDPLLAVHKFFGGINKQQLQLEEVLEQNSQIFLELIDYLKAQSCPHETLFQNTSSPNSKSKDSEGTEEFLNLQTEFKEFLLHNKHQNQESKNTFLALAQHFKNELRLAEQNIFRATDFENYFYYLREHAINKRVFSLLNKSKTKVSYSFLLPKHYTDLRNQIQNVIDTFRESEWEVDISDRKRIERIVQNYVWKNIDFDFTKFQDLAKKQQSEFLNKRQVFEQKIKDLGWEITFGKKQISSQNNEKTKIIKDSQKPQTLKGESQKLVEAKTKFLQSLKDWKLLKIQFQIHLHNMKKVVLEHYLMFIESQLSESANKQEIEEQKTHFRSLLSLKTKTLLNTIEDFQKIFEDLLSTKIAFDLDTRFRTKFSFYRRAKSSKLIRKYKIFSALKSVGLPQYFAYRCLANFDALTLQKISIAKTLVGEPKVLFFSLPKNFNTASKNELLLLIKNLAQRQKIAVVILTDEINLVKSIANWALLLHQGTVVEQGNINKIFSRPIHPFTKYLLNSLLRVGNLTTPIQTFELELKTPTPSKVITKLIEPQHWVSGTVEEIQKWIAKLKA